MTPSPESYWIGNHYYTAEVIFLRIPKLSKIMMNRREVLSASSAFCKLGVGRRNNWWHRRHPP
jgi:hypothetical protein